MGRSRVTRDLMRSTGRLAATMTTSGSLPTRRNLALEFADSSRSAIARQVGVEAMRIRPVRPGIVRGSGPTEEASEVLDQLFPEDRHECCPTGPTSVLIHAGAFWRTSGGLSPIGGPGS